MDEYTIRIEVNGVELWRRVFCYCPSRNSVFLQLSKEFAAYINGTQARADISCCYTIVQKCNSIPGECSSGRIHLDKTWKLRD